VKKLIEGLQFYRDKLHESAVFARFQEILAKARANKSANKPDVELNEFEAVSRCYALGWFQMSGELTRDNPCSSLNSTRHRVKMISLWKHVSERRRLLRRNEPRNEVSESFLAPCYLSYRSTITNSAKKETNYTRTRARSTARGRRRGVTLCFGVMIPPTHRVHQPKRCDCNVDLGGA